uniref:Uncharacterized protein n=1 Tax=Glossina palpalis gambiensis TaxID=67801 RepID=A0A1B0BFJ9_9MUSC
MSVLLNLSCRKSETDFVVVVIIVMCQACCTNIQVSHDYLYNLLESQAKVHMFNETWQVRVLNWRLPHLLPRAFIKCIDKSHSNTPYKALRIFSVMFERRRRHT